MVANFKISRWTKALFYFAILVLLFTPKSGTAAGTTRFVSLDGKDTNPGSIDKPWGTIAYAASQLQPGDTLYLRGGTYQINSSDWYYVDTHLSGTADSPVTIKPYNGEKVLIDGAAITQNLLKISHDYWIIENLEITNFSEGTDVIEVPGSHNTLRGLTIHHLSGGAVSFTGNDNVLEESTIHDITMRAGARTVVGVKIGNPIGGSCDGNIVRNNHIYNISQGELVYIGGAGPQTNIICQNNQILYNELHDASEGIESKILSTENIIKGNRIYRFITKGIISIEGNTIIGNVVHSPLGSDSAIVLRRNNKVINNLVYNSQGTGEGITIDASTDAGYNNEPMGFGNKLFNNTVLGFDSGISFNNEALLHDNIFYNNLSAFNARYQIDPSPLGNNNTFDYNNWYGPKSDHPADGANTLHADPGFIDQTNNNYRIATSSPLVDMGKNLRSEGVVNDIDGRARPQGSGFDIGAYEYSQSGTNPPSVLLPLIIH